MSFSKSGGITIRLLVFACTFASVVIFSSAEATSDCDIIVTIPDTTSNPFSEIKIPVYLDNFLDTIVGFSLWIQTDRPLNVMAFRTDSVLDIDTTYWRCLAYAGPDCIDSVSVPADSMWDFIHVDTFEILQGNIDTTGTLIAGWEYVSSRSLSGNGTNILIVGIANLPGGPVTKGFAPQQGGTLAKILADVFDDTEPFTDSIVNLIVYREMKEWLQFAISGNISWTPWIPVPFWDTNGYVCTQWQIDTTQNPPDTIGCLNWEQTPLPPWDSMVIIVDTQYVLDTNAVCINDGSVRIVAPYLCGDPNDDGTVGNILDLTFFIDWVFRSGPPSPHLESMDVNCDGARNILDLTAFVDRIFRSGPQVCTGPACQ